MALGSAPVWELVSMAVRGARLSTLAHSAQRPGRRPGEQADAELHPASELALGPAGLDDSPEPWVWLGAWPWAGAACSCALARAHVPVEPGTAVTWEAWLRARAGAERAGD